MLKLASPPASQVPLEIWAREEVKQTINRNRGRRLRKKDISRRLNDRETGKR
jgi:hypothetical protein